MLLKTDIKKHNNRRRGCTPEPLPAAVLPVREFYFLGGFINDTIRKFEKTDQGIRKIM
jgi:hypothetical protein